MSVRWCSLCAGLLLSAAGGVLLGGCGDALRPVADTPIGVSASVDAPMLPAASDYATADVKPAQADAPAFTMRAPKWSNDDGSAMTLDGDEQRLDCDFGNTGKISGSLPLTAEKGCVQSDKHAVVPTGDNVIALSPHTAMCFHGVTISKLRVLYTVHVNKKRTDWTLPSNMKIHLDQQRKAVMLKGSFVTLMWNGANVTPPADGKATISATLFKDTAQVASLGKTVLVAGKQAEFTGQSPIAFNRVELTVDLRDAK